MVEVETVPGVEVGDGHEAAAPQPAGVISIVSEHGAFELLVAAVAFDARGNNELVALSACGANTEVAAFRAALFSNTAVSFDFLLWGQRYGPRRLRKEEAGYQAASVPLDKQTKHLVAWSKRPGVLRKMNEEGVWQYLKEHTTTPIHRAWVPYLTRQLEKANLLRAVWSVGEGMEVGIVRVADERLDELVSEGLRKGRITIPL